MLNITKPIFDIYISKTPSEIEPGEIYPPCRQQQINETKNSNSRLERHAVWCLLKKAVEQSFSLSMEEINFSENKGKWCCDKLYFSLSHSHGAIAVAVSNGSCGIDIEAIERFKSRYSNDELLKKMQDKICSEEEKQVNSAEELIELWTKKECIYKCYGEDIFLSRMINTQAYDSCTKNVFLPEEYVFSYCGEHICHANIYVY